MNYRRLTKELLAQLREAREGQRFYRERLDTETRKRIRLANEDEEHRRAEAIRRQVRQEAMWRLEEARRVRDEAREEEALRDLRRII